MKNLIHTAVITLFAASAAHAQSNVMKLGDWSGPTSGSFRSINCGPYGNAVGVTASGELRTWGPNTSTSAAPSGSGFVSASVGYSFGIAMLADGSLRHWGDNSYGQANFPAKSFRAISCGDWTVVAVKQDGSLVAWGSDPYWGITNVPTGNNYAKVASGSWHHLAITQTGEVRAWGFNDTGACAVPQGLTARAVAAWWKFSFAARQSGGVTWWGQDPDGAMQGIPTEGNFIDVALNVSEGKTGGLALRADGTIVSWPTNSISPGTYASSLTMAFAIRDDDCDGSGTGDLTQIATGELADLNSDGIPDICEGPTCNDIDLNLNGIVDGGDLGVLLAFWGPVSPAFPRADINKDGFVNGADLGIVLAFWGPCPN